MQVTVAETLPLSCALDHLDKALPHRLVEPVRCPNCVDDALLLSGQARNVVCMDLPVQVGQQALPKASAA